MQRASDHQIDRTFHALGDPTRVAIVEKLSRGPARITELAAPMPMSLNAVSKHVKVLEQSGLVVRNVKGREHFIALQSDGFERARTWMDEQERFWRERLERLSEVMREDVSNKPDTE